ncbi:MAG: metal-sensitive transcriptional regulator [Chloroflexi bacterium]|nr:metal-sensitive transcriptional regulator [Chloroflexota bacterium]
MRAGVQRDVEIGLKVAAGQLEAVRRMVDQGVYCVDLMKQLSAVQAQLERVNRAILRNHLSTCVAEAIRAGQGEQKIDELMAALKYSGGFTGSDADLSSVEVLGASSCCAVENS